MGKVSRDQGLTHRKILHPNETISRTYRSLHANGAAAPAEKVVV